MKNESKYSQTGVDVHKKGIETFKSAITNMFPDAFCTVFQDPKYENDLIILHTDGAGSKPVQSYLFQKETESYRIYEPLAQDTIAMNLNDIECVGAEAFGFVDYVALNGFTLEKKYLLSNLKNGFENSFKMLKKKHGIYIPFAGGETADLPDQLRTFDVSGTIVARVEKQDVITGDKIKPENVIIGLRSGGKSRYEHDWNSGIMCNGITLARHCLMKKKYEKKYPEIRAPDGAHYYGRFKIDDYISEVGLNANEAITSPTRLFSPIIKKVLEKHRENITGLAFNSGGGQTKCKRLGKNIHYVKDDLFKPDPVFNLIQKESEESWKDMYQDFNMGGGFDIIAEKHVADDIISISEEDFRVGAQIIGKCKKSDGKNRVTIYTDSGKFEYV